MTEGTTAPADKTPTQPQLNSTQHTLSSPEGAATSWVLARFGVASIELHALGNHGGFSGARLWRVRTATGDWCLKAWPPGSMDAVRLAGIHALMRQARDAGLPLIPVPFAAPNGSTCVESAGRVWDLITWMPGRADYHTQPCRGRLRAACAALARLHRVWQHPQPLFQPFPAVHRRLAAARSWCDLVGTGWRPDFRQQPGDVLTHWAERAWRAIDGRIATIPERIGFLSGDGVEVQPCLCDIWHDHVLFSGDAVSGIIDFGSAKHDHVTADLARLLGSLVEDDRVAVGEGLDAYSDVRPLGMHDAATVLLLDQTGVELGIINWLRWLYHERREYDDRAAVARRLAELVRRVENWK
jgi:Ser/Thr protein kinase RdoA (MazF antagonist)